MHAPDDHIPPVQQKLLDKYEWTDVSAPQPWNPKMCPELVGHYGGKITRVGPYGTYEVVLIKVPRLGVFTVSGVKIVELINASMVSVGHPIHVVFTGYETTSRGYQCKQFELRVAQGA